MALFSMTTRDGYRVLAATLQGKKNVDKPDFQTVNRGLKLYVIPFAFRFETFDRKLEQVCNCPKPPHGDA